jgi:hypothetical protein
MNLFGAYLDCIKVNFYPVQGYSSGEMFVPLKRVGQACLTLCTRVFIYKITILPLM